MNELAVIDSPGERQIALRHRRPMILVGALFLVLLLAGLVIPIGGAVIGGGAIGVDTRVKRIAHPTGGVIKAIYVHDGDHVRSGQLLLKLDTTVSQANADLSGRTVDQLLATRARLEAEREGRGNILFPPELTASASPSAQSAMAAERRLFLLRRSERNGTRSQLAQRIQQTYRQIAGYRAQIDALNKQQVLIEPERKGVADLWAKGLVTISRKNQLERTAVDMDGSIASLQAQIAQAEARITEIREQMISVDETARSDAGAELAQIINTLNDQQIRSVSAGDTFSRSDIRAPYDGIVDKMVFSSVGDVVQPAEPIMELVPTEDRLLAEAKIRPSDIDQVRVGQKARARLSTYSGSTTPDLGGRVTFVSADSTTDKDTGATYFRVRIAINPADIAREKVALQPGLPVEIFISTGSRSMLSYATKPLQDQFARAFRR